MSKIGRKPISINGLNVEVKGQDVHYKGAQSSGVHHLPVELQATAENNSLHISIKSADAVSSKQKASANRLWGLHRALLANELSGAAQEFEKMIEINGLGYKATLSGKKIVFALGYSHKIEMDIPTGVSVEIDKSGQKIKVKSSNRCDAGQFCSEIRFLREPEPYKGKGIKLQTEVIRRKAAGKSKK